MTQENNNSNDLSSDYIYTTLRKNSSFYHAEINGSIKCFRNSENVPALSMIENFVKKIIKSDDSGLHKVEKKAKDGQSIVTFQTSKWGNEYKALDAYITIIYEHETYYIYSENIRLFHEACNELQLHLIRFKDPNYFYSKINKYEGELFNDLINLIRAKSQTKEFKDRLRNRVAKSDQQFNEYKKYIEALFKKHSRLIVIRLDLSYLVSMDENTFETKQLVKLADAKCDLEHLLKNRRHNALFEHMVGHIWKLEYGKNKGYHYHLILFFLGSKVQNDAYIAHQIGNYWKVDITDKRGIFHNCNNNKDKYIHLGIGRINANSPEDAHLRFNLINYVLKYFTKQEQYLRIKLDPKDRTIGRGLMPDAHSGRGRPRKQYPSEDKIEGT